MLWTEVLVKNKFSTYGAAQFLRDVRGVASVVDGPVPNASAHLTGLLEGLKLLNLPLEPKEGLMSVKQATDRVFRDNSEAKVVLAELDIDLLTPANARNILPRRIEGHI